MSKSLEGIILKNWRSNDVIVELDESIDDIELAMKYEDHGDEFLLVRTNGVYYEYGWFLNRPGYPDYGSYEFKHSKRFVKKPFVANETERYAGKIKLTLTEYLDMDKIYFIYYNGAFVDLDQVDMYAEWDDYGVKVLTIDLNQFD